jgi:hypothetical protein
MDMRVQVDLINPIERALIMSTCKIFAASVSSGRTILIFGRFETLLNLSITRNRTVPEILRIQEIDTPLLAPADDTLETWEDYGTACTQIEIACI